MQIFIMENGKVLKMHMH